jgi:hypothetical protein
MQYADAVASQVYTTQLIRDRAVDGQEQLILRSILTNPALRQQFNSAIYQRAADALEYNGQVFSARTMSANDPDFYLKLSQFGSPSANVPYLQTAYENRANELKNIGLVSANNEVLLGSGLKAPRTCQGNVATQQGIDQQWAQVNDEYQNRQKLLGDLEEAYRIHYVFGTASSAELRKLEADIARAKTDYETSARRLINMPKSFTKGEKGRPNAVLEICKAIASPAEMVNKGIDEAFKAFSKGLGDYNDNNLPFYMNWVSDIGASIASNLIFGGDVKSTILEESGNLATAANIALNFADTKVSREKLETGLDFEYQQSSTVVNEFTIRWDVFAVKDASYVTINGPGISDVITTLSGGPVQNRLPLSGERTFILPNGGLYSLRIYNAQGQALANTATLSIPKPSGIPLASNSPNYAYTSYTDCVKQVDESYCNANPSLYPANIRGVSVKRPTESLRESTKEKFR